MFLEVERSELRREMGCAVDELVRAVEPEEIGIEFDGGFFNQ